MPCTRAGKRNAKKSSRCSSTTGDFSKTLIASSPIQDDKIASVNMPYSFENCKSIFDKNIRDLAMKHQKDLANMEMCMFNNRMSLPKDIATATLGKILAPLEFEENISRDNASTVSDTFMLPLPVHKVVRSANVFKQPLEQRTIRKTKKMKPAGSKFKTPDISPQSSRSISIVRTITPKMNPSLPVNVMRLPKLGEIAVSMCGSPLLVSAIVHDKLPTVTVPFADGRVFSIMPNPGTAPDDVPEFDEATRAYLKTLQGHLKSFCEP